MSSYQDLPVWQASNERDRRIVERAWNEIPDSVPLWVRQFFASYAPWAENFNRSVGEFVVLVNRVLEPDRVIASAVAEYNRRMAGINRR